MPNKFPRLEARDDFAVSGAATFASTVGVTGVLTATGGVVGNVTGNVTGDITGNFAPAAVAAEHGAGIIGTAAAPQTFRWVENGVIVTRFKIDLTGLASVATANDIICLGAGGVGYIGRNVVATNGVIFKMEMACLEAPAGGDDDINCVANASAALTTSGAGGTTFGINGGDWTAGKVVENLVQGLTANHYLYLTAGTGDTADTYTAGQFVITWYGHPLLT